MVINGRECTIYAILNIETQEKYIGSTVNFKNRKKSHWSELRLKKHGSWKMQRAYTHYGEDKFRFIVLETFYTDVPEEVYAKEQYWIDLYQPEYNVNKIAGSFVPESARTKEARKKHASKMRGRKQSQEEKDKRAQSLREHWALPEFKGTKRITEEQKKVLREKNLGENNPNWGLKRGEETRKRISNSNSKVIYFFRSPTGNTVSIRNLSNGGADSLGISYYAARQLYRGKIAQYKGWTFVSSEKV